MKARLPQGMGGGPGNMNQMIKQAQKMQEDMAKAQDELNEKEYVATSGGGMVTATITGAKQLKSIKIKPEVVDADEIDMLEDLVMGAVNEAIRNAEEDSSKVMGDITGDLNIPGLF